MFSPESAHRSPGRLSPLCALPLASDRTAARSAGRGASQACPRCLPSVFRPLQETLATHPGDALRETDREMRELCTDPFAMSWRLRLLALPVASTLSLST